MQGDIDHSTLEMALVGYEAELQKIMGAMASIRKQLGGRVAAPGGDGTASKHHMSAAARKRIADAQRKRWKAFHGSHAPTKKAAAIKKSAPKKKMSAERKAALVATLAKARAARAAKRASDGVV